ncbi:MAG: type II toxin-antitoxin system RelE/ParE family toxin [Salibacteraceae bacterium]
MSIVIWTPSAIQDLEAIFDFIANSSPDNAAKLIDEIISV